MYNRYIPQGADYAPIPPPRSQPSGHPPPRAKSGLSGLLGGLLRQEPGETGDRVSQVLSSLLNSTGLKDLDTGDILLALIVLFLVLEDGDDLDLLITLGLTILLHLGER